MCLNHVICTNHVICSSKWRYSSVSSTLSHTSWRNIRYAMIEITWFMSVTNHVICTMSVTNIIHVIYVQITWFIAQNKALGQRYRCGHTTRPRKHNLRYKPGPPYFFESCTECTQQIIKRFNNEPGISQNNVGTRVWGNIWLHKTWRSQQGGNRCWTAYGWYK